MAQPKQEPVSAVSDSRVGRDSRNPEANSEALRVRLTPAEKAAFTAKATEIGVTPSRLLRRLIRETVNGAPDMFGDGVQAMRENARQLAAVGRNLNQTVAALNTGRVVVTQRDIVLDAIEVRDEVKRVGAHYTQLIQATRQRWVIKS